jgi:hypothetical protein
VPFSFQGHASGTITGNISSAAHTARLRPPRKRSGVSGTQRPALAACLQVVARMSPEHNFASGATRVQCAIYDASL